MSITPNMVSGGDCGCTGNPLNVPLVTPDNPNGKCATPCPHTHPLDGDISDPWRVIILDTAAFTNKYLYFNGSQIVPMAGGGGSGTVTQVAASISGALSVAGSPINTSGTLAFAWTGNNSQYVLGDGTLATIPSLTGYVPYTGATGDVDLGTNDLNAEGLKVTGVNGNGHLTMRWQAADPISAGNHTTFFANSVGDLKYKIDGNFYTTFVTSSNSADRAYTFPNRSLTIDNITTSTTSNGTGFIKSNGANITFDNSSYLTTAITSLNGLTNATQTFANDTNVTITSSVSTHTLGWSGTLSGTRGGTGVNNGSNTITIAGNLITTGAFNTTFAQQITGTFTLPPVAGTIAASASTLTSGRVPYVTTSGMLTDSSNMTWDNTNKYLYLALTSRVGSSGSSYVEFGASNATTVFSSGTSTIQANTKIVLVGSLQNGIGFFTGDFSYMQSTRTFMNNYTGTLTNGCSGGSFGIRQSADFTFNTVTTNTTANASTTITLANGTYSSTGGVQAIGLGDYISLSSASSTYAAVTAIASTTSITVASALGNGTTQTVNVKPAIFRIFDNASVPNLRLSMNYLGYIGMSNPNPTAWLHLVASTTAAASLNIPSGTAPTSPNNGDIYFDGTNLYMRIGGVTKTFTLI